MRNLPESKQNGFTLIEVILVLVVAAVLGTMMFQYLGTSFTQSSVPIQRLNQALGLQQVMENITVDYKSNPSDLIGLQSKIGTTTTTPNPQDNSYGQYNVIYNDFILFIASGSNNIDSSDGTGTNNLLKVTIQNDRGEILTALFSSP